MTAPKCQLPGQFVELVRRTTHRQFLLRPGPGCRELVGYMYGKALLDTGQRACVASCMSNHYHAVQLDVSGRRSDFMQQFHSNVARKRNLQLGHREYLWSAAEPGDTAILGLDDIVRKIIYVSMQAPTQGCVERAGDWTGFQILPRDWGTTMRFPRPALCGPDMPEFVEFVPMPPPGFDHLPLDEVIAFFEGLIAEEEARLAESRNAPVLGISRCERVSPFRTPKTKAAMGQLNPTFACKDKCQLVRALREKRRFRAAYQEALKLFRSGDRSVVFPAGTIQMPKIAGAQRAAASPNDPRMTRLQWSAELQASWADRARPTP